ncbi:MAG: hypothetical protein HZC36_11260 [Armatimonadetes bacterium]|nr:hypothetical protein [Armatimonadota bacterium]
MKPLRSLLPISLLLLSLGLAEATQDAFSIARKVKAGATARYSMQMSLTFQGIEAKGTATLIEKVVKVESDGSYLIEQSTTEGKLAFQGQTTALPNSVGTMKFKANGEILEINSPELDEGTSRREHLTLFVAPPQGVKTGEKWSFEVKASALNANTPGRADYECLGIEKLEGADAVAVRFSYTETKGDFPASCTGKLWISPEDGTLLKGDYDYKAAPLPGIGPVDMKMTMARVKA